jgi:HK97 family phage prohead protease
MAKNHKPAGATREVRSFKLSTLPIEVRANTDGTRTIKGLAAPFNSKSVDMGFIEIIKPGAFTRTLKDNPDVLMLRDHKQELLLGRTKSGTLTLRETSKGLEFECQLPNNSDGDNLAVSLKRGDIDSCSFGFNVMSDSWADVDGQLVRTLLDIDLFECSVVSFPAYPDSTAALRSLPAELRSLLQTAPVTTRDSSYVDDEDEDDDLDDGLSSDEDENEDQDEDLDGDEECSCSCASCVTGDCLRCNQRDCADVNCIGCQMQDTKRTDSLRIRSLIEHRENLYRRNTRSD